MIYFKIGNFVVFISFPSDTSLNLNDSSIANVPTAICNFLEIWTSGLGEMNVSNSILRIFEKNEKSLGNERRYFRG